VKFSISYIRWYLADLRDIRKPFIFKKDFLTKQFAIDYRDRYFKGEFLEPITGRDAAKIQWWPEGVTPVSRKYYYGTGVWYTKMEKLVIRVRKRKKLYRMLRKNNPITRQVIIDILKDKPMLFIHRYKEFRDNYWAFSDPIKSFNTSRETLTRLGEITMLYPNNFNYISNIIRTMDKYGYDVGFYNKTEIAFLIFKRWRRLFKKYFNESLEQTEDIRERVAQEYLARGFLPSGEITIDDEKDNYIKSVNLPTTLIFPQTFWHSVNDRYKDLYIYEAQRLYGIPGYCTACPAGLEKRK